MMFIDESTLYGDDHHLRCLNYIEQFFQETAPPGVEAVYVVGSVVTGDYLPGYSDLDIMIVTDDSDQTTLMEALRHMNEKLWIPTFHLHRAVDFPPLNLYLNIRMHTESRLLYGQDRLEPLSAIPVDQLRRQLLEALSHRVVMFRSLVCSKAVEKYTPDYTVYYAQKFCLFGIRALLLLQGDWNTARKHAIQQAITLDLLSPKHRSFFQTLLTRLEQQDYPQTFEERLTILHQTLRFQEEVQLQILEGTSLV